MIKDSAKKQFDCVIVWKLDRFARNRYDSAHYKSILKKNDVRVLSATEAISQGAPYKIDKDICIACGGCAAQCPVEAIKQA